MISIAFASAPDRIRHSIVAAWAAGFQTLQYVDKLRSFSQPPLMGHHPSRLNLALPQFPAGTQLALVRQAILIDGEGRMRPTSLTEGVQVRVYHSVTVGTSYVNFINGPSARDQDFYEFSMKRRELFAHHGGGLVAVRLGEREYPTFSTHGTDPFESTDHIDHESDILERCRGCHSDSGIHSVQSRLRWIGRGQGGTKHLSDDQSDAIAWETRVTIALMQRRPDFKLLQGLWHRAYN